MGFSGKSSGWQAPNPQDTVSCLREAMEPSFKEILLFDDGSYPLEIENFKNPTIENIKMVKWKNLLVALFSLDRRGGVYIQENVAQAILPTDK